MQKLKLKIKSFTILLSIFISVLFIGGCQAKVEKTKAEELIPVRIMKVALKDLNKTLEYVGNIKAWDEAIVYPKVSGKIMEKVKEEGAVVNKSDVIAYIDRDEVGLKFEKAPVESPLTGVVGRVYVDIGQNVTAQTPIALVVNMDKMRVTLDIPEKYLPKCSLGQEAKISTDAYPDEEFIGNVTKISPVVNLENRAAPIEITMNNQGHLLKSGMFAKVDLVIEEHKNVPVILKEAIIGKEPNMYVFIIEASKALMKQVEIGIQQGPYVEITKGLKAGDMAVIIGQQRLYDNAPVVAEEEK